MEGTREKREPHGRWNELTPSTESAEEQRLTHIHLGTILWVRSDTRCLAAHRQPLARMHTVRKAVATMTTRVDPGSGEGVPVRRGDALTWHAHDRDLRRPIYAATYLPVTLSARTHSTHSTPVLRPSTCAPGRILGERCCGRQIGPWRPSAQAVTGQPNRPRPPLRKLGSSAPVGVRPGVVPWPCGTNQNAERGRNESRREGIHGLE